MSDTEHKLKEWRFGQTQAERLCATILHAEGFDAIDPQCPLGGPDGLKDVLCEKAGKSYIAACFFPPTAQTYGQVKDKLLHDAKGMPKNNADGLVFFTNQQISPSERSELSKSMVAGDLELYHLQRLVPLSDSPKGYGIRLEYLRINMSNEEQISLLSVINFRVDERLRDQHRELLAIRHSIEALRWRTNDIAGMLTKEPPSTDQAAGDLGIEYPTANMAIGQLCWVHRLVMENSNLPLANRGAFRSTEVWIGIPGCTREDAELVPPPPSDIPKLIDQLLNNWRLRFAFLVGAPKELIVEDLAQFHHRLLAIHPFLDGNGRVARSILQQQSMELLGKWVSAHFTDEPTAYNSTLMKADRGDLRDLASLIAANLE